MKKNIIERKEAVIGMPIYLMVAIVVASLITGIFAFSIYASIKKSQTDEVKSEIEKIISEAENMFEYADKGTLVTVSVDFSNSLKFAVFGSMPQNGALKPTNYNLDEKMSNNYYFVTDDGTVSSYSSNARFSSQNTSSIAVFGPGVYDLSLELEKKGGKTYVKIY